ncbi:MAG: FG-GAP repeat domain-containing protein [Planctomycetota bacterium]
MKRPTRTGLILLACALVSPLFAFHQFGEQGPPLNQQFPGPNGLANFRKIVSGEFTGNRTRDAVVMDLDRPALLVSCEYFDTSIGTGYAANDIAVLSGAVPGKDLLVTVEAGGLKLYERMSGTSSWNITTVRDESSPWANAAFVAVGDVNGDSCPDIVGVAANKRDLLYVYGTCSLTFTTGPTVVNPAQTIHQLLLMNWTDTNDTPATVEAVFNSNLGWAIREDNGVFRKYGSWTQSLIYGVVLDNPVPGPDRLINTHVFGGTDRIRIHDETGSEGPYNLGALGIVGMATGDMTSPPDGDIDLVLSTRTDLDLRIYENQSPSLTTFDFATPAKFAFGPSNRNPARNQAGITVGDFDSDDHADVLAPAQGNENPGPLGPWGTVALIRPSTGYDGDRCKISGGHFVPSGQPGEVPDRIRLTFDRPVNPPLEAAPGTGQVAEFLISLYYCSGLGAPTALTPSVVEQIPIPVGIGLTQWTFDLPENYSLTSSTDFFAIVAFQRVMLDGVTLARKPALVGWLSPGPNMVVVEASEPPPFHVRMIIRRENDEVPVSAAWDQGPTVPPADKDDEPKEQSNR